MKIRLLPACFLLLMLCCAVFCCAQADVLTLPAGTLAIEEEGFYQTASLDEVVLPEGIETIGARAFAESGLTKVNLPASLTYIAPDAFDGCEGIVATVVPGSYGEEYAVDQVIERYYVTSPVEDFGYSISKGECIIQDYTGTDTIVVVPEEIDGCPVKKIGNSAFYKCTQLTAIALPDSLTQIGYQAFYGCNNLVSIRIPNGTIEIGERAFQSCSALERVFLPDSLLSIGRGCFIDCHSLGSIVLPQRIETINDDAFYRCTSLVEISIPKTITVIENRVFGSCSSLKTVNILGDVTSIGDNCFSACKNLTNITLPNTLSSIGSNAFGSCLSLASISLPEDLAIVGDSAFGNCPAIRYCSYTTKAAQTVTNAGYTFVDPAYPEVELKVSVDNSGTQTITMYNYKGQDSTYSIPSFITAIGNSAFKDHIELTTVNIPSSINTIESEAFRGCTGLNEIHIPNTVTYIGGSAFRGCTNLISVHLPEIECWLRGSVFEDCKNLSSIVLPANTTIIESGTFRNCSSLTSIILPEKVTSIDSGAFSYCRNLKSVYLPESLSYIESYAFSDCESLVSISIPESVTTIRARTFVNCSSLSSITLPENLQAIHQYAFTSTGLKHVTLPHGTISIGESAFQSCIDLTSITLPNTMTTIGDKAFYGCNTLSSINIPESITVLGESVFGQCYNLTYVTLPGNLTAVSPSLFLNCNGLTHVTLSNGITSISSRAFRSCDSLTSITIPPSVTYIDYLAFQDIEKPIVYAQVGSYAFTWGGNRSIPTSFPTAVDAFQKESHSEYYEILNGYSYNGQHYFEANLLKPYNGVGANHFFFIDDEGRVVTDVETIRALWTMRMYANNENNINTILSDSTANAKIWSSSAKSFMSKEMISETSGTLIADLIASYSTAGAVFVANLLDGVANNMLDGNEMTAFLQISEIDRLLDYLDKLNNYNRSLSAKDSYGLYDYEAVNTKLRVFVNYMQAYEVTQGLCIPVIERIVSQFENETQVAFHLVGLAFWEGISTIPGVGVVTEIVESAVTGEGNISSLADEMMSLLEKMYELDTATQSLQAINQIMGFVSQSIDTLYGINEAYILEDSPWLDVYFKTTEEILESPMYQNHLLLAQ